VNLTAFKRLLDPLRQRLLLLVGRAVIKLIEEEGGMRRVQAALLAGEEAEGLDIFEHYGFASRPLPEAEAVVLFQGGDRSLGYIVATDDPRYRPLGLQPGEVVIFNMEDKLAEGEELPDPPEGAPPGWPAMPETEDDPAPPLCRIQILPGRTVRVTCQNFEVNTLGTISLAALGGIKWGYPGDQTELLPGGEGLGRVARVGDCVDVAAGSSAGKWPIVESCD